MNKKQKLTSVLLLSCLPFIFPAFAADERDQSIVQKAASAIKGAVDKVEGAIEDTGWASYKASHKGQLTHEQAEEMTKMNPPDIAGNDKKNHELWGNAIQKWRDNPDEDYSGKLGDSWLETAINKVKEQARAIEGRQKTNYEGGRVK